MEVWSRQAAFSRTSCFDFEHTDSHTDGQTKGQIDTEADKQDPRLGSWIAGC